MIVAVNGISALRVLRAARAAGTLASLGVSCNLPAPDPSPRKRWTSGILPLKELALEAVPDVRHMLHVAVPNAQSRLKAGFASCTVYERDLPPQSFVQVSESVAIPCPELLFLEMACQMTPAVHASLGYELCGTYSRDPHDSRMGPVAFDVPPVTSVKKIADYLEVCSGVRGLPKANENLAYVADNSWSPMESVVALMARLPYHELGYGMGPVNLNPRVGQSADLVAAGARRTRVPDIVFDGTRVGINYDGQGHLDLSSIASANSEEEAALRMRMVRAKYVDDVRRNRELLSMGYSVFPVTAEDLFENGGLDAVMLEVMGALENVYGRDVTEPRKVATLPPLKKARQKLIWSLLPGDRGSAIARDLALRDKKGYSDYEHTVISLDEGHTL